jgi:hypothetical protein
MAQTSYMRPARVGSRVRIVKLANERNATLMDLLGDECYFGARSLSQDAKSLDING